MEPISVLSLVANIVQLVDAAAKAVSICHEIYALGASIDDSRIKYTTGQLLDSYSTLEVSLNQNRSITYSISGNGANLKHLASRCIETAKTLQMELAALEKSPGGGRREALSKSLLKKRKAKELEKLKRRLDEYQKALDSKLIIEIMQDLGMFKTQHKTQNINLEQRLRQLSIDMNNCHIPIATLLKSEIDKNITASQIQHVITRKHAETHITAAMQNFEVSQARQRTDQKEEETSRRQYDQFLESLRFDDMRSRMNEVSESHPNTFQWIFREDIDHPWDNFAAWLRGGDHVYWINGKAGSGKSTLMKFLADNRQTRDMLAQWSPNKDALIVATYFWLSGSKMQRSLKGFLCSVIHQIILQARHLFDESIHANRVLLTKRNFNDWSNNELSHLMVHAIDLLDRPICMFIDGLDEFDQDDDVEKVLSIIDDLSAAGTTKICVSSRPEHYLAQRLCKYCQLRLQDLTAEDMRVCIRDSLELTRTKCRSSAVTDERVEKIVKIVAQKADGVFLWVYYAMSSLSKGMRYDDDFGDLLNRVEDFPSGMHQLYLQMWNRLNGDQLRYRDEATVYFSYERFYPLSLFDLLVALDANLQNEYVDKYHVQDPDELVRRCEALQNRILTRCAGLLEAVPGADIDQESSNSRSTYDSEESNGNAQSLRNSEADVDQASSNDPTTQKTNETFTDDVAPGTDTDTDTNFGEEIYSNNCVSKDVQLSVDPKTSLMSALERFLERG
ncbi:MAG: hypothetical protein Q9182_007218 [Xanthomendoza sp. 2 TL-2023]